MALDRFVKMEKLNAYPLVSIMFHLLEKKMQKMKALVSILAFALVLQGCAVYPPYGYSGGYNGYQSNGNYGGGRHHGWGGGRDHD